jgi:hypothetical protein
MRGPFQVAHRFDHMVAVRRLRSKRPGEYHAGKLLDIVPHASASSGPRGRGPGRGAANWAFELG